MISFLEVSDLRVDELREVMTLALIDPPPDVLANKGVALIFEKPSGRTRNSAEVATFQLGGHPVTMRGEELGIGVRESPHDVARTLACYHSIIAARVFDHSLLVEMAQAVGDRVPVVNLLSDYSHPCQALADVITLEERFGNLAGTKVAYVGDGNNVARSLGVALSMLDAQLVVASPEGFELPEAVGGQLAGVSHTHDPIEAVEGASCVYTDAWYSMGQEAQAQARKPIFGPYRVDASLMAKAGPQAVFMHCLPAHRGDEVTDEVIDSAQSIVWRQAFHRLTAKRGLFWFLMKKLEETS